MAEPLATTEPTAEQTAALMARVRRTMLIAALTTALGMSAILIVIGYRLYRGEAGSSAPSDLTEILPKGARIVSTSVAGDRLVVTVEAGGALEIRTFDARTLRATGRLKFANER
jgi:hypothetical protein